MKWTDQRPSHWLTSFTGFSSARVASPTLLLYTRSSKTDANIKWMMNFQIRWIFQQLINRLSLPRVHAGPIVQLMYGCVLSQDNHMRGVYDFTVSGKHTLSLDYRNSAQWTAHTPQAVDVKKILDSFKLWNKSNQIYVQRDCVPRLKTFYRLSHQTIHRRGKECKERMITDKVPLQWYSVHSTGGHLTCYE